jgi:hypothetical protein
MLAMRWHPCKINPMTHQEGWPEEQKPNFDDPFAESGDSLNELFAKVAGKATERTFRAVVEGVETREVAREIISQAGMLAAIGYSTRVVEGLQLFESLNLAETADTAGIFANYRKTRVLMMLRAGIHYTDDAIQSIVQEHETSPAQSAETSSWLYYALAERGDAASFKKWLDPTIDAMLASSEESSEHNPFPEYGHHYQLATVLLDHISAMEPGSLTRSMVANPEEARAYVRVFLDSVREHLQATPRKALLAERIGRYFHQIIEAPDRDLRDEAKELQFAMLKQGVESPVDRHQEHVTDCRLHKQLIMSLIGISERRGMYKDKAQELLDTWEQTGMFRERDLAKIECWRKEIQHRNAPRRKRR